MKLWYVFGLTISLFLILVAADPFLYGTKNFVIHTRDHTEYACVNIKLSFKKFLYYGSVSQSSSSKILAEHIQNAHSRFLERVSQIFSELQKNSEADMHSEEHHRRGKRSVAMGVGFGAIATSAIWYFIDNVRNVNSQLQKLATDVDILKINQKEMLGSIQTLVNASIESQLRIEEDFGINGILKLMNGGLHPEFLTPSQIFETFSNQLTPAVFETLIYHKHPNSIFSFAEVAIQRWDVSLEEASLRVCLPKIKEDNFFVATSIIHTGFFTENQFARFKIPETTVFVNGTQYAFSLKNCSMKGLFHLCPSVDLTELYPLKKWSLNILNVDSNFVDIKIIDNTYLIATKKKHYFILPNYDTIAVPESGIFALTLNHSQTFVIDGIEPLIGLDKVFIINDRLEKTYANMSLELANILEKSKEAEAEFIDGILVPSHPENSRYSTFYTVSKIILTAVLILLVIFCPFCLVIICKNCSGKK